VSSPFYIRVMPAQPKLLLPIIIFSQFAGTSLWFAGNAIIDAIQKDAGSSHANITSVVQFGFIAGTLVFSLFTIADRFPSSKVFFFSALIASAANLLIIPFAHQHSILLLLRFITGFFLAGIYPVGMKIAADLFPEKLGKALGYLVGALVLGTSFPHFVRSQINPLGDSYSLHFCIGIYWRNIDTAIRPIKTKICCYAKTRSVCGIQSIPFQTISFGSFWLLRAHVGVVCFLGYSSCAVLIL
jgi:MFS family permease